MANKVRTRAGTNLSPDEWTGWADMARLNSPEGHQEGVSAGTKYLWPVDERAVPSACANVENVLLIKFNCPM